MWQGRKTPLPMRSRRRCGPGPFGASRTIPGLTADDIAAAFLIPSATMGQRLVRAKTRIRQAGIPLRVPDHDDLPARLDAVLEAIYAAYSKAWAEIGDDSTALAGEAIWL